MLEGFTLARIYKPILSDLDKKQFAVAGKSTEQALVCLSDIALEALDKGNCSVRFFFADFHKGFDLIDHGILLQKLCNYNIRDRGATLRLGEGGTIGDSILGGGHKTLFLTNS